MQKLLKSLAKSKLTRALSPASFKTPAQIESDLNYLASLKPRKASNKPAPKRECEYKQAERRRRNKLLMAGLTSNPEYKAPVLFTEPNPTIVDNPNAVTKYAGFRLGRKNARKILIGCPVEGGIDNKGRVVENLKTSNHHYNTVMCPAPSIDSDHTSIAKSIVYGDPALIIELLDGLE